MAKTFSRQAPEAAPVRKMVAVPVGFVAMESIEPVSGVSWDGVAYTVENNVIVVPSVAVPDMESHGFRVRE